MTKWSTRGLRGSMFEDLINYSIEKDRLAKLSLIQKIPTPITPVEMDENRHITLAYFEKPSTVDYIGNVQGLPVCFDAKECNTDTFPLANVHPHQVLFMKDFEAQDGVAFLLIYYKKRDLIYYLPYRDLAFFWERMEKGGRKSFRFQELDEKFILSDRPTSYVPYLSGIQKDLDERNK